VEAGPALACGDVVDAGVELRIQRTEALGDGLDRLVRCPRGREQPLGARDVAGLDGGDERARAREQLARLRDDVAAVAADGGRQLAAAALTDAAAADDEPAAGGARAAGTAHRVAAGLEREDEAAGRPLREMLLLAEDPGPVEQLELGHAAGAGIRHLERGGPGPSSSVAGSQPASVSLIATFFALPGDASSESPQAPTATVGTAANAAVTAARRTRDDSKATTSGDSVSAAA
jgi:hypothetical protein